MLCSCENLAGLRIVVALESTNTRARERCAQKRILAGAFRDSSPTRIACDVDHRREGPTQARGVRFFRGDTTGSFGERRVPRRSLCEWNGKDGAIPVNRVEPEQQRNFQPRFFNGNALKLIRATTVSHV